MPWPTRAGNESATQVCFLDWGLNPQSFGVVGQCSNHCTHWPGFFFFNVVNPYPMIFFHWFWESWREKRGCEREKHPCERDINWLLPAHTPTRASIKPAIQVHALDLDQKSNWQLFSAWAKALITEPYWQGWEELFKEIQLLMFSLYFHLTIYGDTYCVLYFTNT